MARRSVIVVVPAEEPLRVSAAAAALGRPERIGRAPRSLPAKVDIDPSFPPVPIARIGLTPSFELAAPSVAPSFAVRGTVDEKDIPELAERDGAEVYSDPRIEPFPPVCGPDPAVGSNADVSKKLDTGALHRKQLDGHDVALAIMDTGINLAHLQALGLTPILDATITYHPVGAPSTPGQHPVDHGTMCAFDALIAAPRATLLDFPILNSQAAGGSVMAGFLSDALGAYGVLLGLMRAEPRKYASLVVSNSWGMYHISWDFPAGHPGRYADNPNHPFNIAVGTLARSGADILFAAGNCGAPCPAGQCQGVTTHTIMGANAHPDVTTLAGCDVKDRRVGYSSQGPGIPGMAAAKPDITAYTHFLGSRYAGGAVPDNGTSAACPVAAGCVAALRTVLPPTTLSPRDIAREMRADAKRRPGTGWNRNMGHGIVRPKATARRLGLI